MVGAWVWVWWWWGFRDHGFVITDSWSRIRAEGFQTREHTGERINKLLRSSIQVQFLASIGVIGFGIQRF
ncbi:hypothetical protein I4J22_10965 [Corynebacterium diphtheriae]|uniref:hypothetical protein n=1 Tax=Corynebacterium diphtheriae TaxID=1717 RepID=UPI0018CA8552|nr:hypothetical protein [Corynebacterium diphtheriae]MBG9228763.1 hypothetical protein [Corynebacterium diphtheriae bv. gravis]MBG9251469.1 hypothetical protein [Corynebacterium diphtheriae bv. mitis]MBG9255720.1 hypothetical protein [Corynebacterium diphtheriae bv. mitis]MBG9262479.1 hypothetical protein [Corynebacterium diphtheriae bv. mitis]MBG9269235.1 hypothetical protein [Corynebacterium diphtheriae bv. mitis]